MTQLQRTLGPVMIWGLGVGYVISGAYFGWNLGLPVGGPYGMLAATLIVTVLYAAFVLCYAELSCALPRAGGVFVYTSRAFGPHVGFVGGLAQLVEYVLAPAGIAFAIGGSPGVLVVAVVAYLAATLAAELSAAGAQVIGRDRVQAAIDGAGVAAEKIDLATAARIGKGLGVRYVVVASFIDLYGDFRIDANIVDVESGQVVKVVRSDPKLSDQQEMYRSVQSVADRLGERDRKSVV